MKDQGRPINSEPLIRAQDRSYVVATADILGRRVGLAGMISAAAASLLMFRPVLADNFSRVSVDSGANQLVITMRYRGTNPNHGFTLKWGACTTTHAGDLPEVSVDVLDDQWQDRALREYRKTARFDLSELPCRPAKLTLHTAPRFFYSLVIAR